MTESDFLRRTRASYDALAADYAEWIRDELEAKPLDRALLGGFAELVQAAGAGPVADIGCGAGPYVARINGAGKRCIGIDLDPRAVEQAQTLGRPVFPMSADDLAFADNAFDSAVLIETLEHLPNYDRALSEATLAVFPYKAELDQSGAL